MDFGTKVENISAAGLTNVSGGNMPIRAGLPVSVRQNFSIVNLGVNYKLDPGFLFW
jgi:hypothetical protein